MLCDERRETPMLENLKPPARILPCKVRAILQGLETSDRDILIGALADTEAWKDHVLSEELGKRGLAVSPGSIRKHRHTQCSCGLIHA
jgi:hypothetical protein